MNDLVTTDQKTSIATQSESTDLGIELKTIRHYLDLSVKEDDRRGVLLFTEMVRKLAVDHQRLALLSGHCLLTSELVRMTDEINHTFRGVTNSILREELAYHGIESEDIDAIMQKLWTELTTRLATVVSKEKAARLNHAAGVK